MAGEVKSAARATEIATSFLKLYYPFVRPISAVREAATKTREADTWIVKVDVGIVTKEIAEVKIDASTAEITVYSFPK